MDEGFEDFVRERGTALLRIVWLLTGHHAAAEDLLQEALTGLARHWERGVRSRAARRHMCAERSTTGRSTGGADEPCDRGLWVSPPAARPRSGTPTRTPIVASCFATL